jgi:hypothetical protein
MRAGARQTAIPVSSGKYFADASRILSRGRYHLVLVEIWGDESGNLDFDPHTGSKHFIVATMTTIDTALAGDLLSLRRDLAIRNLDVRPDGFHATEDKQAVRNEVFAVLARREVRVDCTVYTKQRLYPRIQADRDYFYKWAWFYHMRYVLPRVVRQGEVPFIGIATLGEKRKRTAYAAALRSVGEQCLKGMRPHLAYWSAASHPCLQAVDYYCWAVQRLVEGGDNRSYDLIRHQVRSLYSFV